MTLRPNNEAIHMRLDNLVSQLDSEFSIASNAEDLLEFAVTDDNRHLIHPDFLIGKTGLMLRGLPGI